MKKRLTKSRNNIVISGVIGGFGEYFGIDPTIIRVILVFCTFFGLGGTIPIYFILAWIMPRADKGNYNPYTRGGYSEDPYASYHNYGSNNNMKKKRKEAEKVDDDDWSDF